MQSSRGINKYAQYTYFGETIHVQIVTRKLPGIVSTNIQVANRLVVTLFSRNSVVHVAAPNPALTKVGA